MKKILLLVLFAQSSIISLSQNLHFEPFSIDPINGRMMNYRAIDESSFFTVQKPQKGGIFIHTHYYDSLDGSLKSTRIKELNKKKLITINQLDEFNPFISDGDIYSVARSKDKKELLLRQRDKYTLAITGADKVLFKSDEKLIGYSNSFINDNYIAVYTTTYFYNTEPDPVKALIFRRESLEVVTKFNLDENHKVVTRSLSTFLDNDGYFYTLAARLERKSKRAPLTTSRTIDLKVQKGQNLTKVSYTFDEDIMNNMVIKELNGDIYVVGYTASSSEDGVSGVRIKTLKLKGEYLEEIDEELLSFEELFKDNYENSAQNLNNSMVTLSKVKYSTEFGQSHHLADGSVISIDQLGFQIDGAGLIKSTIAYKINHQGEVLWSTCFPTPEIATTCVDSNNGIHLMINDFSSRYSDGSFVSYSNSRFNDKGCPVHIELDQDGNIVERKVISKGFKDNEIFELNMSQSFNRNILFVGKKEGRGYKPLQIGRIELN